MKQLRRVSALAAGCTLAFGGVGCRQDPEPVPLMPHVKNDMASSIVIELRAGSYYNKNYEVPPLVRASLSDLLEDSMTARVFRSDCSALGTVQLTPEMPIIYVESDGRVHVGTYGELAYTNPTPYMTELAMSMSGGATGCSGD